MAQSILLWTFAIAFGLLTMGAAAAAHEEHLAGHRAKANGWYLFALLLLALALAAAAAA